LQLAQRQQLGPTFVPTVVPVAPQPRGTNKQKRRSAGYPARGISSFATFVGTLLVVHAGLASMAAGGLYLYNQEQPKPANPAITVSADVRAQLLEAAQKEVAILRDVKPGDPRVHISLCEFGEYVCELAASENQNHWARSFEIRPYARTVAFVRRLENANTGRATLQLRTSPSHIPRKQPLLVIGVRNINLMAHLGHDVEMIEVLGFVPVMVDAQNQVSIPDITKATWLMATPEAEKILQPAPLP
jgi:hypothetical protein